jgi:hypothetical protein
VIEFSLQEHEKTGLPRPVAPTADGGPLRPVPWSQESHDGGTKWGILDDDRGAQAGVDSLCLVCGAHVAEGVVLLVKTSLRNIDQVPLIANRRHLDELWVADGGPLHDVCLKITRAHCKSVRENLDREHFTIIRYMDIPCVTTITLDDQPEGV